MLLSFRKEIYLLDYICSGLEHCQTLEDLFEDAIYISMVCGMKEADVVRILALASDDMQNIHKMLCLNDGGHSLRLWLRENLDSGQEMLGASA